MYISSGLLWFLFLFWLYLPLVDLIGLFIFNDSSNDDEPSWDKGMKEEEAKLIAKLQKECDEENEALGLK